VGAIAFAPRGLFVNYFTVQLGKPQAVLVFTVIAAVLNLGLGIVLIPAMGYGGAAWAATIAYSASMALVVVYFLANAPVRFHELWRVDGEDLRGYLAFGRQLLSGRKFGARAATPDTD
jgi:Na+-driven multidrug efflux pump